jgi:hypothetical protein
MDRRAAIYNTRKAGFTIVTSMGFSELARIFATEAGFPAQSPPDRAGARIPASASMKYNNAAVPGWPGRYCPGRFGTEFRYGPRRMQ